MKSTGVPGLDQRVAESAGGVALAGARQAEGEHVDGALEKVPAGELARAGAPAAGQPRLVERVEGLARRQVRGAAQPLDAALRACLALELEDLQQHGSEAS